MIREARESDIPAMVEMGRKFFDLTGWSDIADWSEYSFAATLRRLMSSDDGVLLVIDRNGPVGMAGALLYPFYFSAAHRTGQELFWWVDPEARGREATELLDRLEQQAREQGAMSFTMIAVDVLRSAALARYYTRRGYRAAENTFIKGL